MLLKLTNYFHVNFSPIMLHVLINIEKSYTVLYCKLCYPKLHARSTDISFSNDLFLSLFFTFIEC